MAAPVVTSMLQYSHLFLLLDPSFRAALWRPRNEFRMNTLLTFRKRSHTKRHVRPLCPHIVTRCRPSAVRRDGWRLGGIARQSLAIIGQPSDPHDGRCARAGADALGIAAVLVGSGKGQDATLQRASRGGRIQAVLPRRLQA